MVSKKGGWGRILARVLEGQELEAVATVEGRREGGAENGMTSHMKAVWGSHPVILWGEAPIEEGRARHRLKLEG